MKLSPCPFCGMKAEIEDDDTLYPTGRWREDDGFRHYLLPGDLRTEHGKVWTMHCPTNYGGCGAQINGDSRDEAIVKWNRRATDGVAPTALPDGGPFGRSSEHG